MHLHQISTTAPSIKDRTIHPPPSRLNLPQIMAMSSSSTIAAVMAVALLFAAGGRPAEGQSDCAAKLVPCAEYLNSTNPSSECCDAMKTVVTTQLPCLCGLLKNPTALGVNLTQALELPKYCNLPSDTSACKGMRISLSSTLSLSNTHIHFYLIWISRKGMGLSFDHVINVLRFNLFDF